MSVLPSVYIPPTCARLVPIEDDSAPDDLAPDGLEADALGTGAPEQSVEGRESREN
jgi:hypothetical protein